MGEHIQLALAFLFTATVMSYLECFAIVYKEFFMKNTAVQLLRLAKLEPVDLLPLQNATSTSWVEDCTLIVGDTRIGVSRTVRFWPFA